MFAATKINKKNFKRYIMTTKAKATVQKVNKGLVNASMAAINTTVANGEKWQKLTKKLLKKSEPVRKKQMNMVFETATAVKTQATAGAERMMDLVGYDASVIDKAMSFVTKNPVSKKVMNVAGEVADKVSKNPVVKKVEKTTDGIKKMSIAKYNDVKEDVLEQASKILKKGEALVEEAKEPKKTTKQTKAKGASKVKATKKTTAKKATTVRKTTAKKVATVEKVAKKVVKEIKNEGTEKVADVLVEGKKKVAAVKKETVKAVNNDAQDDLKIIHGIGPKLEKVFNKNGINKYADLAKADMTLVEKILDEAGPIFKNTDTADWKKQAEVGAENGVEALKTWVARYRSVQETKA
jgi:predicted flap endonuclease-1-like 5' DNA nuclease